MPPSSNAPRRTLLLTGASRGIGHATAIRFSSAGWRVITCSRHAFPEVCPWGAGPEDHIEVDLADHADTTRAISEIRKRLENDELHALVNNAAISPKAPDGSRLSTMDTDIETWSHVFRVNFFAPIMMARGLIEELKHAKGAVVNVTSIAGSRVHPFAGVAYATSKAALASLTREMASDFGRVGVRVNRSRRARSTPRSCRRAPRRSSSSRFRCTGSARRTRSPRSSMCCARKPVPM
jgi:NAD(P)-dependent dehydrogenase (short-subunit alcohol dehydrogenase family)